MNDFERELESELHRIIDPMTARPIPARRVAPLGGTMHRFLGGAGAALGVKIATGFAVAAMAATAAAAATEVASTGSLNPADWGQQVRHQVQVCKDSLRASGTHGIGECVSQFAQQHGKLVSGSHHASDARDNGHGHGNGNGHDNGNANGHGKDKGHGQGSSKGQGPSTSSTNNEPTDQPATPRR